MNNDSNNNEDNMSTVSIDLATIDHIPFFPRAGKHPGAFFAGVLELDVQGDNYWEMMISAQRLDGCPVDYDWIEAFGLFALVDSALADHSASRGSGGHDAITRSDEPPTAEELASAVDHLKAKYYRALRSNSIIADDIGRALGKAELAHAESVRREAGLPDD